MTNILYVGKLVDFIKQLEAMSQIFGKNARLCDCKLEGENLKKALFGKDINKIGVSLTLHDDNAIKLD